MKTCTKCAETKPFSEFYADKGKPDGLRNDCKPCKRGATKKFREENPEVVKARKGAYREANPEKVSRYWAEWYAENSADRASYNRQYRKANPERVKAYKAAWYAVHPEYHAEAANRRRACKNSVHHEPYLRTEIFARWNNLCCYCNEPATALDHVTAISRGGADAEWNLVPACMSCNSSKHAKSLAEWALTF